MAELEDLMVSVLVPVYNEEGNVEPLHGELLEVLGNLDQPFEIIYIDDGSRDRTQERLIALPRATVIAFSRNFGKSQALQAGFDAARGRYIVTLDGDLQDDPRELPALLERAMNGVDLVCGWKRNRLDPTEKRVMSRIANWVVRVATGLKIHDMNCCFKAYSRDVAKSLRLFGDMHRYIPALVSDMGYVVDEIPVHHRERLSGRSKYGLERIAKSLFDFITLLLLRRFTDRPMYLFGSVGAVLSGAGFAILFYLSALKVVTGALIGERPLLLLGVLLAIIGFQSLSLGFLGELLIRQQSGRRHYIVRRTVRNE